MDRVRDHIDDYRGKCIQCGSCREVCPSYRHGGCDPMSVMMGNYDAVFDCVGCGSCTRVCENTEPKLVMLAAYSIATNVPVSKYFWDTGLSRSIKDDPSRDELQPQWGKDDCYVMPGCIVSCLVPYLEYATSVALKSVGIESRELPDFTCCTYPIQFGVMFDEERDGYRVKMGETAGDKEIVTICAGCSEIMSDSGVNCEHVIPFIHHYLNKLPKMDKGFKVSLEPGCTALPYLSMMKDIVLALGCEPIGNEPGCCGKTSKKVSGPLMSERQEAAKDADVIVVGCPMCFDRYNEYSNGKPVMHISELIALAAGDKSSLKYHRNTNYPVFLI